VRTCLGKDKKEGATSSELGESQMWGLQGLWTQGKKKNWNGRGIKIEKKTCSYGAIKDCTKVKPKNHIKGDFDGVKKKKKMGKKTFRCKAGTASRT